MTPSPRGWSRPRTLSSGLLLCGLLAGCVTLDPLLKKHEAPPTGPVAQVAVTWEKTITFVPDFTHGGMPNPGLVGRMYLFGPDGAFPLAGDGTLGIELFDDTPLTSGGPPVLREKWEIDKDTLKGCLRKDTIGWGYTVFLPWGTYSPAIRQIHLMARYTPHHGVPYFSPSQTISLIHPERSGPATAKQDSPPVQRARSEIQTTDALGPRGK